jgi:ABC-2 type transport system permease protein
VIERIVDRMNLRAAGVTSPPLSVEARGVTARSVEYYDFLLPGLVAMGVMNFSITGMAVAVARYREQRILKRILATPLRPFKFLAAQVLARLVLALVQAALIVAVGVFLFGARIYGNVAWIFLLATVANLIFLNIGFAVAGRSPNPDSAQGIASAVAIPMMFLSGVFFPTDTLPQVMQTVVRFLPLTPLIEALRKVSLEGLSIVDTGPQLLLLGVWGLVSFALAAVNFRFARS